MVVKSKNELLGERLRNFLAQNAGVLYTAQSVEGLREPIVRMHEAVDAISKGQVMTLEKLLELREFKMLIDNDALNDTRLGVQGVATIRREYADTDKALEELIAFRLPSAVADRLEQFSHEHRQTITNLIHALEKLHVWPFTEVRSTLIKYRELTDRINRDDMPGLELTRALKMEDNRDLLRSAPQLFDIATEQVRRVSGLRLPSLASDVRTAPAGFTDELVQSASKLTRAAHELNTLMDMLIMTQDMSRGAMRRT